MNYNDLTLDRLQLEAILHGHSTSPETSGRVVPNLGINGEIIDK
jgi:hypothetical protein